MTYWEEQNGKPCLPAAETHLTRRHLLRKTAAFSKKTARMNSCVMMRQAVTIAATGGGHPIVLNV